MLPNELKCAFVLNKYFMQNKMQNMATPFESLIIKITITAPAITVLSLDNAMSKYEKLNYRYKSA